MTLISPPSVPRFGPTRLNADVVNDATTTSLAHHLLSIRRLPGASSVGFHRRADRRFEVYSLEDLLGQVTGTATELASALPPETPVLIVTRSPEATLRAYLAAVLAGRPAAIFPTRLASEPPELTAERILDSAHALGPHGILTEDGRRDGIPETGALLTASLPSDSEQAHSASLLRPEPLSLDSVVHYQFSSGSTRKPAAIAITNGNLLHHMDALAERVGVTPESTIVSWLPMGHDMGLIGKVLLALMTGADLRLMSPFEFMTRPVDWLKAISDHRDVMTAAPTMAFDVTTRRVHDDDLESLDLSSWTRSYCGAEPVHVPTLERFARRFAPHGFDPAVLMPTYGLAEATLMATMPEPSSTPRFLAARSNTVTAGSVVEVVGEYRYGTGATPDPDHALLACLGPPSDGLELSILDEQGDPVTGDRRIGEISLAGPSISTGLRNPAGGIDRFETPFHTGDLGFLHDGELVVVDRIKSVLIWNGQNYSASLSEHRLANAADIPTNRVLVIEYQSSTDQRVIGVVAEIERGQDPDTLADVLAQSISGLEHPVHAVFVLPSGGIPRTTSGKQRRDRVRTALSRGSLGELVERHVTPADHSSGPVERRLALASPHVDIDLDEEDARGVVYRLINETLRERGRPTLDITDGMHLRDDLGFDSLDLLDVCVGFEEALGVAIREDQLPGLQSVGDLIDLRHNQSGVALGALIEEVRAVPQVWRTVTSQRGRLVEIDGHRLVDLASVNYLGLDLDPEVIAAIPPMLEDWGVHPSWTRAVASPAPYERLEALLAELTGTADTLVFPSISLLHLGVLPLLVKRGSLIVEQTAHQSIQVAADTTRAQGGDVRRFEYTDLSTLEAALRGARPGRRIVALDGVYSMSGELPPLGEIADLAENHGADVYVDDAHGIGVIGSDPTTDNPYGSGGGGIVRHLGLDPARFIYVSGLSKSFSSMAAFITIRNDEERRVLQQAGSIIFSGPVPVASLASAIKGLEINAERGDALRDRLLAVTRHLISTVDAAGFERSSQTEFPIINVLIGALRDVVRASQIMWNEGVLLTPSVFPAAPLNAGGLRISLTASHSDEELAMADRAIQQLAAQRRLSLI